MTKYIARLLLLPSLLFAQGSKPDYERATGWHKRVHNKIYRHRIVPEWSEDDASLTYVTRINEHEIERVKVDCNTGEKHRVEITRGRADAVKKRGRSSPESTRGNPVSPDKKWTIEIRDHNVYLKGEEEPLSADGKSDNYYGGGKDVYWSPDSSHVVILQTVPGDDRKVTYIESAPKDQLQPQVKAYNYLKPGDRVNIRTPRLFRIADRKQISLDESLYDNPFWNRYIRWSPDSSRFTFLHNQRGHQALRMVAISRAGEVQPLVNETSETFIDYAYKTYFHWLDQSSELIWMSERDGWNHLYLYDAQKGTVKNQITSGPWMVREVLEIDEAHRHIYFLACGLHDGEDPYHEHYVRTNFEGTEFTVLTEGDAMHEIHVSPGRTTFIDHHTRADQQPRTELRRRKDGSLVCVLEEADITPLLQAGFPMPQRFVAKGRDGKTDIWGLIFTPSNLDPTRKYPVIEYIYAGPHDYHVPKSFYTAWNPQPLAELGFILVQIDGMGTNWRGKKFHDVCWKNLKDAGFPDRKLWITAAADQRPYMDLSRVGIYGGSAGGQNAMAALLWHNDFYHAAAADCGCHDNRMDKIWWNEAWMGWPVGPHYAENSNVEQAHLLKGDLLLTVGEADRNVDPASTMQVVDALIKANKDFEFIVFPGKGHGIGSSSAYAKRRMADFFVRSLWGTEPRY